MITIATKSANYNPEAIKFFHNLYIFALEITIFQFCYLFVHYFQGHRSVTSVKLSRAVGYRLPENFAYKPGLSFNPLARVILAVGLPYLLLRALDCRENPKFFQCVFRKTLKCENGRCANNVPVKAN